MKRLLFILFLLPYSSFAQENDSLLVDLDISLEQKMRRHLVDLSIEDYVNLSVGEEPKRLTFYGFLDAGGEKYFNLSGTEAANYKSEVWKFKSPRFHIYGVSHLSRKFTVFLNLGNDGDSRLSIINAWGNIKFHEAIQLRLGKMYRRFDLFNERLDQTAAIIGIDPPELYSTNQHIVPLYTLAMLHGQVPVKSSKLLYALMFNNGESGQEAGVMPLGWDIRIKNDNFLMGLSGYYSAVGSRLSKPTQAFGESQGQGVIAPWMEGERYRTVGAYGETLLGNFSLKAAYYLSHRNAVRSPEQVVTLSQSVSLSAAKMQRFFGENATAPPSQLTEADVIGEVSYQVQTFYVRTAYHIYTPQGEFIPFAFADFIKNPESVPSKAYGGSSKVGLSDDGVFFRPTLGLMYKPVDDVAVKTELSVYNSSGYQQNMSYPEFRVQIAYMFK